MDTKKYKIEVAYDGTDFQGWQRQKHTHNTITQYLEDSYKKVFGEPITIIGASRTDAGVHSLGQIAQFRSKLSIPDPERAQAWNNRLPDSIVIRSLQEVDESFHPQKKVEQKTYWFHFFLTQPLPLIARYGWFYRYELDIQQLEAALKVFEGTHDFRSFCTGNDMDSTIRTVDSIELSYQPDYGAYRIEVKGPGFLRYQIRRMVGAALEVASRPSLSIDYLKEVFAQRNPEHTLPNAPARGLVLQTIRYKE